jgi:hypothetical protein
LIGIGEATLVPRATASALAILAAAAVLGAGMQVAEHLYGLPGAVTATGAPWLVAAFAAGACVRTRRSAVLAGAALLGAGTALWYAAIVYGYGRSAMEYATAMTVVWGAVAAVAGGGMALAGVVWRRGGVAHASIAAAVPVGALAGEALLLLTQWHGRAQIALLLAELAAAGVLLALLASGRRSLRRAALAATGLAAVFAVGEAVLREAMRAAGWHGA